jgi:hypothetical protein
MKHKILACLFGLIIVNVAKAQTHSISINSGYAWKSLGTSLPDDIYFWNNHIDSNLETDRPNKFSLGEGTSFECQYAYNFNKQIGLSLDVEYMHGKTLTSQLSDIDNFMDLKLNAKKIQCTPSILLKSNLHKMNIILAIGPSFSRCKFIYQVDETGVGGKDVFKYLYNGNLAIGLKNKLQFSYRVSKKMEVCLNVNGNFFNYSPSKKVLYYYTNKDIDKLNTIPIINKQTNYVDELVSDHLINPPLPDPNKPREKLRQIIPFSSVGLNAGFIYRF